MIKILHDTGLQVAVHVSGDRGIDMTLTAFEQAMQANPRPDARHRIEHGIFPTVTALQRMKADSIILSTQPQWIGWYGEGFSQSTNEATMGRMLPLKTMLTMGIHLAFGCDVPASQYQEPKWAFNGAVLRKSPQTGTIFNPGQKLTPQEALRIHTMGSAYASFAEDTTGSLEPGKCADLVIWSHDLYTMNPTELINLAAEMTIVGGEIAFDAGKNPVVAIPSDNNHPTEPEYFQLLQNYPNPFNPETTIKFQLPVREQVRLSIYNMLGQEMRRLVDQELSAGYHSFKWDGKDDHGNPMSSGIYYYRLQTRTYLTLRKMVFLK